MTSPQLVARSRIFGKASPLLTLLATVRAIADFMLLTRFSRCHFHAPQVNSSVFLAIYREAMR